jgi:arabinose-5-phosphate isomerase
VDEIMNPSPRTIMPEALAEDAMQKMNFSARPVTALFVVDEAGMVRGILHIHDLLRAGVA